MKKINNIQIIAAFVLVLIAVGCATQSAPKGGPKDSLPPLVKHTVPVPYATNFSGKRVEIEFDEFVVLKDQSKLFFVSPQMEKKAQVAVKGKSVVVDFQDTLRPDQTYRLDFGASIADNNEGNRMDGYTFTFSTGDKIDSLVMVGGTLDAATRDTLVGAFVPFYDVASDSTYIERGLDSTVQKSYAEALFRSDSSGYFVADILKGKDYRAYAFLDNNGNQLYEAGFDLVAFSDTTFNPLTLPSFSFGYDSTLRRMYIDSLQVDFELFKEEVARRQQLSKKTRPLRNKLMFEFAAPNVQIDSLVFDSIPSEWIIEERSLKGDTVYYWIAPPTKEEYQAISDTIAVDMVYLQHDSIMVLQPAKEVFKLGFKEPEPELTEAQKREQEEAKKEAERLERQKKRKEKEAVVDSTAMVVDSLATPPVDSLSGVDSTKVEKPVNKFGFKVEAAKELNPENDIVMTFDYPLRKIDSLRIKMVQTYTQKAKGARMGDTSGDKLIEDTVAIQVFQEGLRRIRIRTDWVYGADYKLQIADSVFENIIFEQNDSLHAQFKVLDPDEFGTITIALDSAAVDTSKRYIVELVEIDFKRTVRGAESDSKGGSQKLVRKKTDIQAGDEVPFRFLKAGTYYIRITEDSDRNGEWTTGKLDKRILPERVRLVTIGGRPKPIESKEKWEIVEHVNINDLFE